MNKKIELLLLLGISANGMNYDSTLISEAYAGDCLDYTTFNTWYGGVSFNCGSECNSVLATW